MESKKDLYIDNTLVTSFKGDTLLDDIYLEHNSLPEIDFDEIDTSIEFFGKKISFPLIINSMTGGSKKGLEINEMLLQLSRDLNIPFAVGSQQEELRDSKFSQLFLGSLEDDKRDDVIVISNLSAKASIDDINLAMNQIKSHGISLYLNAAQEAISFDGDKKFKGVLDNIENISRHFSDKLIVKEKGMGMSKFTVERLYNRGVRYIDISGFGGTNFVEMENLRNYRNDFSELYNWGIPTAKAIINARKVSKDLRLISSGGIKTGLDIAKSLIIGADYVGVGGEVLKFLLHGGYDQAKKFVEDLIYKTKTVMFLLGVKNIEELKQVEYRVTGKLKEIL